MKINKFEDIHITASGTESRGNGRFAWNVGVGIFAAVTAALLGGYAYVENNLESGFLAAGGFGLSLWSFIRAAE